MKGLVVENKKIILKDGLDVPTPQDNEVLVKVVCASVNPTDLDNIQGKYDLLLQLSGGSHPVKTGLEFSGVVLDDGGNFNANDKVFGYVDLLKGLKTHQECICVNANYIALMPANLSFEQAAALPLGSLTSLVALTELGEVQKGTQLLINGASGGLGVYALQLAKILGATTTAMAGPGQEDFLLKLGANEAHNYKERRIEDLPQKFDVLLDFSNKKKFQEIKHILSDTGKFIPAEPNKHIVSLLLSYFTSKKTKYLLVDKGNQQKLTQIAKWVEEGQLKVFVDSIYQFSDYEKAFQRLNDKGKQGRVVMKIEG